MASPDNGRRSIGGKLGAARLWTNVEDPTAHTAPARKKFDERFELQVDPEGVLEPEERARRAGHARRAYFLDLAIKSAKARAAVKNA